MRRFSGCCLAKVVAALSSAARGRRVALEAVPSPVSPIDQKQRVIKWQETFCADNRRVVTSCHSFEAF